MPRGRKVGPEQVVVMLRQIEVQLAQGKSLALACKEAGVSEQGRDRRLEGSRQSGSPALVLDYRPPSVTRALANHLPTSHTRQSSHQTRPKIPVRSRRP